MTPLDRVVVVVPARDEQATIARCVASVLTAADRLRIPVDLVVVADACRDRTAEIASAAGAHVVQSAAGCVGAARAAGVDAALTGRTDHELRATWIACTDADSVVPAGWLAHHARRAAAGFDLLLGTVRLAGPVTTHVEWRNRYAARTGVAGHPHVHGANLGVRASTYRAAGGFPRVAAHEDREFVERVRALGSARTLSSTAHPVRTSDRLLGRTPAGVAHDLSA